ncbi:hypothetical protein GCM10010228_58500 [Streptomyces massasporeus]|nr:hypothetical protein GCM10010228_58500 [Streptomyces massasporeus]
MRVVGWSPGEEEILQSVHGEEERQHQSGHEQGEQDHRTSRGWSVCGADGAASQDEAEWRSAHVMRDGAAGVTSPQPPRLVSRCEVYAAHKAFPQVDGVNYEAVTW